MSDIAEDAHVANVRNGSSVPKLCCAAQHRPHRGQHSSIRIDCYHSWTRVMTDGGATRSGDCLLGVDDRTGQPCSSTEKPNLSTCGGQVYGPLQC